MIPLDRNHFIAQRLLIKGQQRDQKEQRIAQTVIPYLHGMIAVYSPIRGEVDITSYLKEYELCYPHTHDKGMTFYRDTQEKRVGLYGIEEPLPVHEVKPEEIDVILVPVVAFQGIHRIGYGGGYYDRYLRSCHALKIGLAFDCQQAEEIELHQNDVPLDMIVTESRIIKEERT